MQWLALIGAYLALEWWWRNRRQRREMRERHRLEVETTQQTGMPADTTALGRKAH